MRSHGATTACHRNETMGCSVSTSFAYLLTQKLKGMKVQEVVDMPPEGLFELLGIEPVTLQNLLFYGLKTVHHLL